MKLPMKRHLYPRCPSFERSGRQCHRSQASLLLAAISGHITIRSKVWQLAPADSSVASPKICGGQKFGGV